MSITMITQPARGQGLPRAGEAVDVVVRSSTKRVAGYCTPEFAAVRDAFIANFDRGELGASFALTRNGECLVDLWGGFTDPSLATPWERDTIAVYFSCSKMAAAMVVHRLVASGELQLDQPLTVYWPELRAGQAGGTLRMALAHTLGLPALSRRLRQGAYDDHDYMADQLAAQEPLWEPGTQVGYHPITFGFILGEIVRRVTGQSLGACFDEWFAKPLALDLWIGLPAEEFARVAPIHPHRFQRGETPRHVGLGARQIGSIPNLWMFNSGGWSVDAVNTAEGLAAEIPAATGVGNARSLATLLEVFNTEDRLADCGLNLETVANLATVSTASHCDATLLARSRFSLGFMKSMDNRDDPRADNFIIGESAFGHVGHGGSFGFCEPASGISAAYVMNQQGPGILLNERGQSLIDACYRSLGYSEIRAGAWCDR